MAVKVQIIKFGNPLLRKKCSPITKGENITQLLNDMQTQMDMHNGIGIAASQIGVLKSVCIVKGVGVMINPELFLSGDEVEMTEGCLSIPYIHESVSRPSKVRVNYFDEEFNLHTEEYDGMIARIIQHEKDHLDGILFIDRLPKLRRKLIDSKLKKLSRS